MASRREWAYAYLEQAADDLNAAQAVQLRAPSDFCMLMQMTFEKAAKAALLRKGDISIDKAVKSHSAAARLIQILKSHGSFLPISNLGARYRWKDVLPLVTELERAQPALAPGHGPQLEYPWENQDGAIRWPAKHFPMNERLKNEPQTAPRLLKFAGALIADIHSVF